MPVAQSNSPRGGQPPEERDARSRFLRLLSSGQGMIRGTLSIRERSCGKSNCKCARGEKHASLYIVVSVDGKYKQKCVPKSLEPEVRAWVAQYQRAQELLDEISCSYWSKLQDRGDR
jgi:hypothetical protein